MHGTHGASSQLKRTTCNVCRERKVRCDREKPQCQRCRKSGHRCVYSTDSTDKDEIKSALNVLHSRLVQAETRLQEHGLQNTTTKSTNSSSAISSNLMPGDPQPVYDLVLQQGDEMDYSDFTLSEFDDSSNRQRQPILDSVNTTGINEAHSEQTLNLTNTYTETTIPSDIISAVPPDFMSYMWQPSMTVTHEPTGPAMNQQPGETRPFLGLERQYQAYFDIVQKHIMLIDQQEFTQSVISVKTHQCMALKSAVAMSGLSACGESVLAMQSYCTARFHLERAENLVDGSSFLNLETVQALLLISRFEFSHISGPKGLMTLAQAMQLISVQGYDMLDQSSAESDKDTCQTLLPKSPESDNLRKIRQIYWTAFTMHCNAAASFPCCIPVKDKGIFTALPVSDSNLNSGTDTAIYLSDEVTKTTAKGFNVFAVFILSMKLVVEGDRHRQMTRNYVSDSASDYNFCLVHEKIGGELTAMFNSLSTVDFLNGPDVELRVLTLIIILGARIDWFKTAIIGSQKAAFLGPIAKEYQTSCLSVANAMCDLLQQADVTEAKQINSYKEMSFFIMRPLILAAEVLLDTLQNPQDTGFNASSTTREVRHNLRMLCDTMTICKPETGQYDLRIQACSSFLDKSKLDGVFSTGFFRDESR